MSTRACICFHTSLRLCGYSLWCVRFVLGSQDYLTHLLPSLLLQLPCQQANGPPAMSQAHIVTLGNPDLLLSIPLTADFGDFLYSSH